MINDFDAMRWAKWALLGDDYAPDLPSYHPLKPVVDRIAQAIIQAVRHEIDQRKK